MHLHSNLKFLRNYTNTTQAEFGKIFGKTRSNVDSWERGNARPDEIVQKKVSEHFNIPLETLLYKDMKTHPGLMLSGNGANDQKGIAMEDLIKAKDDLIKELRNTIKDLKTQNEMLFEKVLKAK